MGFRLTRTLFAPIRFGSRTLSQPSCPFHFGCFRAYTTFGCACAYHLGIHCANAGHVTDQFYPNPGFTTLSRTLSAALSYSDWPKMNRRNPVTFFPRSTPHLISMHLSLHAAHVFAPTFQVHCGRADGTNSRPRHPECCNFRRAGAVRTPFFFFSFFGFFFYSLCSASPET